VIPLIVLHVLSAALLAGAAAAVRGRRPSLAEVGLEFSTAFLLPVAGTLTVGVQILLEALFGRLVRPTPASRLLEPDEEIEPESGTFADELRIGTSVAPLAETLATGDEETIDLALQRLARAESPAALARLRQALASGRREVRVRVRGLMVRLEDRLVRLIRTTRDPAQRGLAFRRLALLSLDPITAAEHLEHAAESFREALALDPSSAAGLDLGRVLLAQGKPGPAGKAFSEHLYRHPSDPRGYLGRAEARLGMRDLRGVRLDLSVLAGLDPRLSRVAARWLQ
jgi:hypothetical protein